MQLSVAGLPGRVKGYAGLQRGIASQGQGVYAALWRGMVSERGGGFVLCTERRAFIRFRGAGAHRGACVLRLSSARVDHLGSGKRLHDQVQRL